MFKRILLPVDFSPSSQSALVLARERFPDATLRLLHVIEPKRLGSRPNDHMVSPIHAGEMVDSAEQAAHKELQALARPTDEVAVLVGDPADRILWAADHWDTELVLMGTHGRTGLAHLLVGSVAEEVVRRARVPVLVTKELG